MTKFGEHTSSIEMLMGRVSIVFDFTNEDDAEKFYDFVVSTALDRGIATLDFRQSRVARADEHSRFGNHR